MIKILSVFGTRPEAIKMAPVVRELARRGDQVTSRVCVTAQHREMLDQVLDLFEIVPDYDLDLMKEAQSLSEITARVFTELDPVIEKEQPDWVLVQGDTTTVMAASLVAFYHRVRVGHVEAGLRTHDKWQPFPEEVNRKVAGAVADVHFAPTATARDNLLREGVADNRIIVTGNPVIDALLSVASRPAPLDVVRLLEEAGFESHRGEAGGSPPLLVSSSPRLILVTAHRRENFGEPLARICQALLDIVERYDDVHVVYPVHLNPNVQEPVYRLLGNHDQIKLLPPLGYLPLIHLMKRSYIVLTDSGGIQEEAPGLGKPVLVLREKTERPEAVEAGTVRLVGTDRERIVTEAARLLEGEDDYRQMAQAVNPYGDGHAAERIVGVLLGENVSSFEVGQVSIPAEGG